jgi:hypothetical protein
MRTTAFLALGLVVGWAIIAALSRWAGLSADSALVGGFIGYACMAVISEVCRKCPEASFDYEDDVAWGGMDGLELHANHMRRDRVVRHAESTVTFPAGDVA